jgi:hypothetical protein
LVQAQIQDVEARAEANRGQAIERASRVDENQALAVERRAAAIKDQDQGFLALVKAMQEIETEKLGHVEKIFTLSDMLMNRNAMNQVQTPAGNRPKAEAIAAVSPRAREVPQQVRA